MGNCGTVLVIDRDPAFRAEMSEVLAHLGAGGIQAESGEAGLRLAVEARPALVVVEVELPGVTGFGVLRALHDRYGQELPVILVSADHGEAFDRTAGILVGADDYLVKPVDRGELAARIQRSLRRAGVVESGSSGGDEERPRLSPREQEVLELLAVGRTQPEIAEALVISSKTVGTHLQHILSKLGVHSRAQAVARAYQLGLVGDDVHAHAEVVD